MGPRTGLDNLGEEAITFLFEVLTLEELMKSKKKTKVRMSVSQLRFKLGVSETQAKIVAE